jgi:hypothetical protein
MNQYDYLGFYICSGIWLFCILAWYIKGITILCEDAINRRKAEKERAGRQ